MVSSLGRNVFVSGNVTEAKVAFFNDIGFVKKNLMNRRCVISFNYCF